MTPELYVNPSGVITCFDHANWMLRSAVDLDPDRGFYSTDGGLWTRMEPESMAHYETTKNKEASCPWC